MVGGHGFNQAERVQGANRWLLCAGQTSVDAEDNPQHAGDMGAQVALAVDNLEAVLAGADMSLANVVRLNLYTTDRLEGAARQGLRGGVRRTRPSRESHARPGALFRGARRARAACPLARAWRFDEDPA